MLVSDRPGGPPCFEPALWLPCVPGLGTNEYYFDWSTGLCSPKDQLTVGCLDASDPPSLLDRADCNRTCETPAKSGTVTDVRCFHLLKLHRCRPDLLADTFHYDASSHSCQKWDKTRGCYEAARYFVSQSDCASSCFFNKDACSDVRPSSKCSAEQRRFSWFFNPVSRTCNSVLDLCLAGPNQFNDRAACAHACPSKAGLIYSH